MKYDDAVTHFEAYARRRRFKFRTWQQTDVVLAEYFADLYEDGEPYNEASYTLFGYILLRTSETIPEKQLYPKARGALKGWASASPQSSRTGADPLLWYLIASTIADFDPPAAAALLLQLDSYARPSEILGLHREDVIQPSTKQCRFWGLIFGNSELGLTTKNGTQDDTILLDSLDRDYAPLVLQWIVKRHKGNQGPLFPNITLASYEAAFRRAKQHLQLNQFQLTPHSVRHSGPSVDALNKSRSSAEIQARGRWRCAKSLLRYQKPGQMLAKMNRVQQQTWSDAKQALPQALSKIKQFYGVRS